MPPDDVDARFSLANERTFLAWIRTCLALLAGAVGLLAIDLGWPAWVMRTLAAFLAVVAGLYGLHAWRRWSVVEKAMTARDPIPPSRAPIGLAGAVGFVAIVLLILAVV